MASNTSCANVSWNKTLNMIKKEKLISQNRNLKKVNKNTFGDSKHLNVNFVCVKKKISVWCNN